MNPTAQISHLLLYGSPLRSYSDMYKGVPTVVSLFIFFETFFLAKPKSASFSSPPETKILAGFMSLREWEGTCG